MAKQRFIVPFILATGQIGPGENPNPGLGSGTTTPDDDIPYTWEMWSVMFDEVDEDGDGTPGTWDDYVKWMTDRGFGSEIDYSEKP